MVHNNNSGGKQLHTRRLRIGVDLDRPSRLQLLKTWFNACYFFSEVEVKATENGYHFRIRIINTVDENIHVRRNLSDDPGRLRFDEVRRQNPELHSMIDTLFSVKWRRGKVISKEKPCNIFSEPFITKMPSRKP